MGRSQSYCTFFPLDFEILKAPHVLCLSIRGIKKVSVMCVQVGLEMPVVLSTWVSMMARMDHYRLLANIMTTMQLARETLSDVQGRVKVGSGSMGHGRGSCVALVGRMGCVRYGTGFVVSSCSGLPLVSARDLWRVRVNSSLSHRAVTVEGVIESGWWVMESGATGLTFHEFRKVSFESKSQVA